METPPRSSTIIRPPTPLAFDSLIDTSRFSSSSPPSSPTHLGSLARAQISSPWRPSIPIASLIHPSTEETMSVESPLLLFDSDKENVLMHSLDSHASIPSSPLFPGPECKQAQNERDTIKFPATDAHVSEVPLRDLMNLSTPGLRLTRSRTKLSDKHGNAECLASTSTGPVKIKVPIALSVPKELPRKMDVPRKVRGSTMSRDPRIPPRMRLPPELTEQQSVDRVTTKH